MEFCNSPFSTTERKVHPGKTEHYIPRRHTSYSLIFLCTLQNKRVHLPPSCRFLTAGEMHGNTRFSQICKVKDNSQAQILHSLS